MKVAIESLKNRYRIRFTLNKKTYCISTGLEICKPSLVVCQQVKAQIELDHITGSLDLTLQKYKQLLNPTRNQPVQKQLETDAKSSKVVPPTLGEKKDKNNYKTSRKQNRLPFSSEEIELILNALRTNQFCSKFSAFKHSHYVEFVETAFLMGLRNAELIGLQVKHCDFNRRLVEISSTLARTKNCTNSAQRIRKQTKTGNVRFLPMSDRLYSILWTCCQGKGKEDLIFLSHKGLAIDDKTLQKRVLKPILKALGLADRDLYAARHSFGSRAVEQGIPVNQVAALMGHSNSETTIKNYIHNRMPDKLPDL